MGRFLITNSPSWNDSLRDCFSSSGFTENAFYHDSSLFLTTYSKLNIATFNFWRNGDDFIAVNGTLVYKGLMGEQALKLLYSDLLRFSITEVRRDLIGNFVVAYKHNDKLSIFVDETGTYAAYYYHNQEAGTYLLTNTYYHVEKCTKQEINDYAYMEETLAFCIIDNQTPFKNIFRLMGNEVLKIDLDTAKFSVDSVELNHYRLEAESIEDQVQVLHDKVIDYFSRSKVLGTSPCLFTTGGTDSRLYLAIYMASGYKPLLANWQGSPYSMNSKPEDQIVARKLAEKFGLDFMPCTISEEGFSDREFDIAEFDKYGEYACKYGNNQSWFQIFHNKKLTALNFGCFGETLRGGYGLDMNRYYEVPMTIHRYAEMYIARHYPTFTQGSKFDFEAYKRILGEKLEKIALNSGLNINNLSREDCAYMCFVYRLHADTVMVNLANMFGYSVVIFTQKEISDLINQIPYEYRMKERFNLLLTKSMYPELLEIPYFTHCCYKKFNSKDCTLDDPKPGVKSLIKSGIKQVLLRTVGGGKTT